MMLYSSQLDQVQINNEQIIRFRYVYWDDARTANWLHACTKMLFIKSDFEWQFCFKDLQTFKTQTSSREKPVYFVSQLIPLGQTSSPTGTVQPEGAARTCCWQDEVSFSPVWLYSCRDHVKYITVSTLAEATRYGNKKWKLKFTA